jgi:hypothetical protein
MAISDETRERDKFLISEYNLASNAYFRAVDIGISWVRSFFLFNGALLGVSGAITEFTFTSSSVTTVILYAIISSGVIGCFVLFFFSYGWNDQINACIIRCCEIEKKIQGHLFRRLYNYAEHSGRVVKSEQVMRFLAACFLVIWIIVAIAVTFFGSGSPEPVPQT